MDDDHDRLVRIEVVVEALNRLNDERDKLLVQRFEIEGQTLAGAIETLRSEYKTGHELLVQRVDSLASAQAGLMGTSAGTVRIFLVAAVLLSFAGLLFSVILPLT